MERNLFFCIHSASVPWIISVSNFQFLTLAHKAWGYSHPLRRLGSVGGGISGGGHKTCGYSTA